MTLESIIYNLMWEMVEKISKVPFRNLVISEFRVTGLMTDDLENQAQKFEVGVGAAT